MKTITRFQRDAFLLDTAGRLFLLFCFLMASISSDVSAQGNSEENAKIQEMLKYYGKQIYFVRNEGQFREQTLFKADFPLGKAIVTSDGMMIATYDPADITARQEEGEQIEKIIQETGIHHPLTTKVKGHGWKMNFLNHSSSMSIQSKDSHADVANFFSGNTSVSNVTSYGEIWYSNVYSNVDVRYYPSAEGTLEYDIICKPGFNKSQIAIQYEGIEHMEVLPNGHLQMKTSVGNVDFPAPVVYQKINGVHQEVTASYSVSDENIVRFDLGEFNTNEPLIIDPIALRWATWVNTNSSDDNHGHCIWVDQDSGYIYMVARVVGTTDQITPGAFDESANGNLEMIVGKYKEPDNIGEPGSRIWQTYIGGNQDDNPYAMEQGPDGNLYITGYTASTNFPLIGGNAFTGGGASIDQSGQATDNIFIMKITRDGKSIKSSVIGGDGDDGSFDLRISEAGDIVICGNTASSNLATLYPGTGATNSHSGVDAIVFKINQDLSSISWMKNYGGTGTDQATIMVENIVNGDIFVGGYTTSNNFTPLTNARQSTIGGTQSGFLQKFSSAGNVIWSSYFQSAATKSTSILCMEFNVAKTQLYFGGITSGLAASNIAASGVYDQTYNNGSNDFFVCRMDTNQNYVSSTYLGGSSNEVNMMGLNTDLNNDVYIFGYTNSTNFPVSSSPNVPLQSTNLGSNDKVFTKINSDLSSLLFSTYYGGSGDDYDPVGERGIKFFNCRIYTIVTSKSNNIPLTQNALNTSRISTTPYEPGLVVWANPPDLLGNSITGNQTICAGTIPDDLTGSEPAYNLPTIIRNVSTSAYPALPSATTYEWQISTDSMNWATIPGATAQDLPGTTIGALYQKTFFRRIIGGDACILAGAADQVVTVRIVSVSAQVTNVSCNGAHDGQIAASSDGVAPFTFHWNTGETTGTLTGLAPGTYTVTVTDNGNCTATNSFSITEPALVTANAGPDKQFTCVAGTTTLTGSSNIAGAALAWTTPDGHIVSANSTTATVDAIGTYVLTATNPDNGCIGRDTAYVTLTTANSSSTANVAICDNETYTLPDGVVQSAPGTYTSIIPNHAGCDSTITTNLSVNPTYSTSESHAICQGGSYPLPWGGSADHAGDFTWTYQSVAGCDSVVTIHISVNDTYSTSESHAICQGGSYPLPWGGTADHAGDFTWTYQSVAGCDSVVTIHISVNDTYSTSESHAICQGGSYPLPWGGSADHAGDFTWTYQSLAGCDSVVTIHISVNDTYSTSESHAICQGGSYPLPWGGTADHAGDFTWTYQSVAGCDSVVTIHISVNDTYSTSESHAICQGGSYPLPWGGSADHAGDFTWTYQSLAGCDSVVTIHITVNPVIHTDKNESICQGASFNFPWGGSASTGGNYSHTYQTTAGCDSSVTIHLSVNPAYHTSTNASFCNGTPYTLPWGQVVTSAGSYSFTYTTAQHCDSIATVVLSGQSAPSCTISTVGCGNNNSICQGQSAQLCGPSGTGYSYTWSNGSHSQCISVNATGTYTLTVSNGSGCNSTCTKTITVNPIPSCNITVTGAGSNNTICQGQSAQLCGPSGSGYTYSWSNGSHQQCISVNCAGTYTLTVTNASGCRSTCRVTICVSQAPSCSISTLGCGNNNTICSGQSVQLCGPSGSGYTYSWSNGSHAQCISVNSAGTYTLTVTNAAGCSSTCSKTIYVSAGPSCSITATGCGSNNTICQGQSVTLTAPSGSGYTYSWSNGSHNRSITVNSGGTYSVTVTNSAGCSSTCTKIIVVNPRPSSTITAGATSLCSGQSTTLCAPGGTGLSYTWNNGSHGRCLTISSPGTYSVTVTNSSGCSSSSSICITSGARPSSTITGTLCFNSGSSTTLYAPSGTGYYYTWSNGSHNRSIVVNCTGSYSVTVSNGCGTSTSCVYVSRCSSHCRIVMDPTQKTLTVVSEDGLNPGTISWNGDPNLTGQTIQAHLPGLYEADVTDADGKVTRLSYTVEQPSLSVVAYPNPFNSVTTLEIRNNHENRKGSIEVYSLTGKKIAVLFEGEMEKERTYLVKWDAKETPDGIYLYKIICGDDVETGRLTLIRE
ncbi:MAG TPA: T9SS type A sorting domain-containing protein [Bacteroidia bacterium]|nr:T9SS type A sorting domain-containing protein [Bacteroidia bacterium]